MKQTNIIGDSCKDSRIDYDLIDRINKQYEREERKEELKGRLAKKKITQKKERKEKNPAVDIRYIKTPDELRKIKGNCSLQNGVYTIDFDIYIPQDCGLILEPGVEFYFTKDAGITCEGRFEAKGEEGLEVLLTAKDKNEGWKNLYLRKKGKGILDYAKFSYGKGRKDKAGDIGGGAVLLEAKKSLTPSITINNSCFESNSAKWGGVIHNYKGNVTIGKKNIFKNNFAQVEGGVIYSRLGRLYIDESKNTFIGNGPYNDIYDG